MPHIGICPEKYGIFILAFHLFQYNLKSASIFFFIRFSKTELFFHGTFKTIIFNIHFEEKVCNTNWIFKLFL